MTDHQKSQASTLPLTDDQIEVIAERAADRAIEKLTNEAYKAVGKSVVQKFFWIVGVCAVALYVWLQQKGLVK